MNSKTWNIDPSKMTGLEVIQAVIDGKLPPPPIAVHMNIKLVEAEFGRVVFLGAPIPEAMNPMGSVHGGWYGTIMDSAMGCAVHTVVPSGSAYTTLEYKVNITRAAKVGVQLRAVGNVLHSGRSTAVAEATLVGVEDGKIYATASTTCIILGQGKGN